MQKLPVPRALRKRRILARLKATGGRPKRLVEGILNKRRLDRDYPFLKEYRYDQILGSTDLEEKYSRFVSNVSIPRSAISLQLSCLLLFLCYNLRPTSILDLGSGFSSYVLRCYRRDVDPDCIVCSVDDDPSWLQKTADFLAGENMSTEGLMPWTEFRDAEKGPFDFILHDIGHVVGRVASFSTVVELLAERGTIILDDMHKRHFREPIQGMLGRRSRSLRRYDISEYTMDGFGRYAWMVRRR